MAKEKSHGFTRRSAERIARTVREWERVPSDVTGERSGRFRAPHVYRFKVTGVDVASPGDADGARVVLAKVWSGTEVEEPEVPLLTTKPHAVDDVLFAVGTLRTGATYQAEDVLWLELHDGAHVWVQITDYLAGGGAYGGRLRLMPLPLTEASDDDGAVDAQASDFGDLVEPAAEVVVLNAREIGRAGAPHLLHSGKVYAGRYRSTNADGTPVVWVDAGPDAGELFRVDLATDGGSGGGVSSAPSFTYTVTAINGEELGTGLQPEMGRAVGLFTAATKGWAFYAADASLDWGAGALVLAFASEAPEVQECEA